jgi:hypothetical protein
MNSRGSGPHGIVIICLHVCARRRVHFLMQCYIRLTTLVVRIV